MPYNQERARRTTRRQIGRFGGLGYLRRAGDDRACIAGILDYAPRVRDFMLDGTRRVLIAAQGLSVPPHHQQDQLIIKGESGVWELYRIVGPVVGPRPNGTAIFYDAPVLYDSTVDDPSERSSEDNSEGASDGNSDGGISASDILDCNASDNDLIARSVLVGFPNNALPDDVTYIFTSTPDQPWTVLIGVSLDESLNNLVAAINHGPGEGTKYGQDTPADPLVTAARGSGLTVVLTAKTPGVDGNLIGVLTDIVGAFFTPDADSLQGGA